MNTGQNPLENFAGFDDFSDGQDLFSQQVEEEENNDGGGQSAEEEEEEEDTPPGSNPNSDEEEEEEQREDFFSEFENSNEDQDEEEEEEEDDEPDNSNAVLSYFKKKGLYNEEEDKDLGEDEIFDKAIEKNVEETLKELPDIAKQFNRFVIKGGNPEEFFKAVASDYKQPNLTEDLDMGEKANQELVVKTMLAEEGNDDEEIEAQLEYYKDSGKLEKMATKKFEKWKEQKSKRAEDLAKARTQQAIKEKEKLKEDRHNLSTYLSEKDKVGDIPFTPEDKNSLPSYMVDKSVKLQNGTKITQFQKELYYDLPSNQEAFMQLGAMMRNRNEDGTFNFEAIKEEIESQVSSKAKKQIRNSKGKKPKGSGSRETGTKKKSLAEIIG